jgi:putative ABC transport system ATP-binding protein
MTVTAETDASITCRDLVRIYSTEGVEVQALQGLTLRVDAGELVAIVGASGSGKSTLLGILSGLDRPTAGAASVAGHDLLTMSKAERLEYRRTSVGFVWQQSGRNLLPYLTARENIELPMVLSAAGGRTERSHELLGLLGIAKVADRRPGEMSGGEQQRVAIAVGLSNSPRVLLTDEPTGELDEATSIEVLETLRSVNASLGITTLIVTHDPSVSEHVKRTVQIRDGRTSTEVLRDYDASERVTSSAEQYTVIDSVGRLQLPEQYVTDLGLRERVRLALETDRVSVYPSRLATDEDADA